MHRFPRVRASRLFAVGLCAWLITPSFGQVSVRSVRVLGSGNTVEIEVDASDRILPQTQVLTGPDRLVVDLPNSLPGRQVRNQSVDRGDVKDVRVGLFQSAPPVTRVVLDLKAARSYQVFPYGRTVMIKVMGDATDTSAASAFDQDSTREITRPGSVAANYMTRVEPGSVRSDVQPALLVSYRDGLLGIHADKATLSEVLFAVQQRTGVEISIPAGAEQEKVVAEIPPAPAPEVLARLLNGSRFNFLILSTPEDPRELGRVILTARTEGSFVPSPSQPNTDSSAEEDTAPARTPAASIAATPVPTAARPEADFDTPEVQDK